jgi:hypothetical protein
MDVRFTASEFLAIRVEEQPIPIHHYLRQPQRLVTAISDPRLMEPLSESRFRLKMRPLNFLELYHFQPTVVLKVWAQANGSVYLNSESCEMRGIDYINNRFFLNVKGKLSPHQKNGQTYLQGQANLEVKVQLPPPLWLTPTPLLEVTGNRLLKSVLLRIKQKLLSQLLQDYRHWANSNSSQQAIGEKSLSEESLVPINLS